MSHPDPTGPTLAEAGVGAFASIPHGDGVSLWVLAACAGALLLVAFAAAAETALQQVGVHRLRKVLDSEATPSGHSRSDAVKDEHNHTRLLITLQSLHILMLFNLGGLATTVLTGVATSAQSFGVALLLILGLVLVVEIVVRAYARAKSQALATGLLPLAVTLSKVAAPFMWFLLMILRPILPKNLSTAAALGSDLEDLEDEIRNLQVRGLLEQDQGQILQSVFQFGETIAKEVMVPRVDMVCVELDTPLHQVLDLMIGAGYTRLPVWEESIDNVQGLVHAKDLLRKLGGPDAEHVRQQPITKADLREILIVPGTKKIAKILRELQQKQITMAIVLDEYGGTDGIMTLEDIVEEIVGEITDEYDQAHEGIQLLKDGSSIVDAKIVIEDVNEFLRLDLPVDEHETLGGYVYGLFGRVPQAGERVGVDGLQFTVESVHKQRIKRVLIEKSEPPQEAVNDENVVGVSS